MSGTMLPGNLIEKILQILPSLTSLDISDNDFGDEGLIDVCEALKNHTSIIELKLDRNWVHRSKSSMLLSNKTFFSQF
jgi:Ran GTPase-activating protein (RanGAP) involved in mRNA processing and transport